MLRFTTIHRAAHPWRIGVIRAVPNRGLTKSLLNNFSDGLGLLSPGSQLALRELPTGTRGTHTPILSDSEGEQN